MKTSKSDIMNRLAKAGSVKTVYALSESPLFDDKDTIPTQLHILNVAFSGKLTGGFNSGLSLFAGESKSFKTLLALYCMKAYLEKYPEAMAILYDSEFGVTPAYLSSMGIDPSRVLHIPLEHIEHLKFDMVKKLEEIKRGDKVFFLVDSIGNLASKKEVEDALDEKSVADMTRAKAIKSFYRIVTPHLTIKDIPCVIINHVYASMDLYSVPVVSGGTSSIYASNNVFIISKSQEKDGTEIAGYKFTINISKSRTVKEKSKLPFTVYYDQGIDRYSGVFDIAKEYGIIGSPKVGWYGRMKLDKSTGEWTVDSEKLFRKKELINNDDFYKPILSNADFVAHVEHTYSLGANSFITGELEPKTEQVLLED